MPIVCTFPEVAKSLNCRSSVSIWAVDMEEACGIDYTEGYDEARIIAADSKPIRRTWIGSAGEKKFFHGLIGLSISVFKEENFKNKYEAILDEVFESHSIPRGERLYKGSDIYRMFHKRPKIADSFVFKVAQKVAHLEGIHINVFFSTISIGKQLEYLLGAEGKEVSQDMFEEIHSKKIIPIYGTSSGRELVTVSEFLGRIENIYPALCAWKLTQITKIFNQHFLLDNLEGEECKAWEELVSNNFVELVPRGDQCSAYISSTDMMLKCIDSILDRKHLFLNMENLIQVAQVVCGSTGNEITKMHVHGISNSDIPMIAPSRPRSISSESFIKHPALYIYNEKIGTPFAKDERVEIENSPMMNELFAKAYSLEGGIAFYHPDISTRMIKQGDFFVTYGENGKKKFKELKRLGYLVIHFEAGKEEPADK